MSEFSSLCVYCGSSNKCDPDYLQEAHSLGQMAARKDVKIVFGGGRVGLMGAVANGALEAGGEVYGIIPQHLQDVEVGHNGVTRLEIVENMHVRKMRMFDLSDAFCILPGGLGTLDETFEILTWKQLTLHDKPIVILNYNGFWDPLIEMINHQVRERFVNPHHLNMFTVVETVEEVFEAVAESPTPHFKADIKWV